MRISDWSSDVCSSDLLRADSINAFCAGDSSRKRAIFSTSSGGIDRQIHHSIILSMGSAALGKSSTFCVASQNQAPSFLHILVILTTYGASNGFLVMIWPSSVTLMIGQIGRAHV